MSKQPTHEWDSLGIAIRRLDIESQDAYQGFLQYAWLTGKERTSGKVAEILGFSHITVKLWSQEFNWSERVSIVDALRWQREFKEREKLLEKDNQKFAEENRQIKSQAISTSKKMLNVANNLLNSAELIDEMIETGKIETVDGRMVPTHTVIKMKAKISDIPRLVDTAMKVSRLAQDLPTEIVDHQIPIASDLSNLSVEELMDLRDQNQRVLREKGAISKIDLSSNANN